jgi:hypothetical protein
LASNGALWVIKRPAPKAPRNQSLVRLSRDLRIDQRLEIGDQVTRMSGTDDGVLLFGRKDYYGAARLVDVQPQEGESAYRVIAEFGADLPIDYVAARDSMAAILSDTRNLGSHRYLIRSSDGGRSWRRIEIGGESPQVLCLSASQTWVAGQKGIWHLK